MPKNPQIAALAAKSLVVIVGPTASGKTELAVALAQTLGGEIVSADSRQIYRALDAGTSKPERDARGRVGGIPYHLVDFVDPETAFDAGQYAAAADSLIAEIRARGRLPIIAGGTGLYIRAALEGLSDMPPRDEAVRQSLMEETKIHGSVWLHQKLALVDPQAAQKIPPNNIQRLVRALEVHQLTGRPISSLWGPKAAPPRVAASFYLHWPLEILRQRITARAEAMWPNMLAEVDRLRGRYTGDEPGFQSLGYRQAVLCSRGELTSEAGLSEMIRSTLAYAKRQRTWFRHQITATEIAGGDIQSMRDQVLGHIS